MRGYSGWRLKSTLLMKKNKVKWFKKKLQSSYLNIIGQRFSVPSMASNSNVSHSARESVVEDVFK